MVADSIEGRTAEVREFNRYYTRLIGVLDEGMHETRFSLAEARVIFELGRRGATEVADLRAALDLDSGYLSRLLGRFDADGLVTRERSTADARRQVVALTPAGRAAYAELDERSDEQIRGLLGEIGDEEQRRLVGAMGAVRAVLDGAPRADTLVLRPPYPGEFGWIVHRHGALYAQEYGWDDRFEALVAEIVAGYLKDPDPRREAVWIAELDGRPVGCVFCVRKDDTTAQLRLLLVEPSARGCGVGGRLVAECMRFARHAGYTDMTLWTNDVLSEARRIYERAGFELVEENRHHSFGKDLVGQNWHVRL
ncbi:MAG: bifunctional helix-turn-helix transcriptional regulator/GNAT family N-acetyltransferase [Pseudonocardia sp.]